MVKKKRFTVPFFHVISNSSGPSTGSVSIDQPWPTLKEKEGLNSSVRYSPGSRAFSTSGRGRPLASSWPPAPPQALSVKTRSVPSSPTTSSAALALRLLTLVMPIILPSPYCCGRERALEAARIGSQLFAFDSATSDQMATPRLFDTFATRLSAQALRRRPTESWL